MILFQPVNFIFLTSEVQSNLDLALLLEDQAGMEDHVIHVGSFTSGLLTVVVVKLDFD